jgi:hypothetical protein
MLKNSIQKTYLKIKDKWWFFFFTFILFYIFTRLLDNIKISDISDVSFFGVKALSIPLRKAGELFLGLLKININLASVLLGLVSSVLLIRVYKKYFIFRKRKLRIIDAWYGTGINRINITRELNNSIFDNKLKIVLSNNIAGDPLFGKEKEGLVKYVFNKQEFEKKYKENEIIDLP